MNTIVKTYASVDLDVAANDNMIKKIAGYFTLCFFTKSLITCTKTGYRQA